MKISFGKHILNKDVDFIKTCVVAMTVKGGGAVATFLMNILLSRLLGAKGVGLFYVGLSVILAGKLVAQFGLPNSIVKYGGIAWAGNDKRKMFGIHQQACILSLLAGITVTGLIYFSADFLGNGIFHDTSLPDIIRVLCAALVPYSLAVVCSGSFKAINRPAIANFVDSGGVPFFIIAIIFILSCCFPVNDTLLASGCYVIASLIVCLLSFIVVIRSIRPIFPVKFMCWTQLINSSYHMMLISLTSFVITWSSSILLGVYAEKIDVGLYCIADRTATSISLILIVVNSIVSPRFAALYSQNKTAEMQNLAIKATIIMASIASLPLLLCIFFPEQILGIFGKEFTAASKLLVIIAVGQTINVATGSVAILLLMSGHERLLRNNLFFVAIISLFLNVTLIKLYGAVGAAISSAFCLGIQNIIAAWLVYKKLGIRIIPSWKQLKSVFLN